MKTGPRFPALFVSVLVPLLGAGCRVDRSGLSAVVTTSGGAGAPVLSGAGGLSSTGGSGSGSGSGGETLVGDGGAGGDADERRRR